MPRQARNAPGGIVYHVLNRANGRLRLFKKEEDYLAFEQVMKLAFEERPIRVLGWCLMPTHWHLVLWPRGDGELTAFMRKLTHTHAQRWKTAHDAVGHGHLYQGRFKSFPVQSDAHLLTVLRYVERNPLRGKLVQRVQDWPWSSYAVRRQPRHELHGLLSPWPIPMPADWTSRLNSPQTPAEQNAFAEHIRRNRPFGDETWIAQTAKKLGLQQSIRPVGRPIGWRKNKTEKVAVRDKQSVKRSRRV
jgi:putative transposase